MRNAANKMTNPIDPYTENHFFVIYWKSERHGTLCGSHSGSLWLSLAKKALARLATSQLRRWSFSHSKFSIYPSRPATRSFCHYPTRSRPEVKNHYPSGPGYVEKNLSCVEISDFYAWQMWRNLKFLLICHVKISPRDKCEEIYQNQSSPLSLPNK